MKTTFAAVLIALSVNAALAGEQSPMKIRGILVTTATQTIAVPGQADHQVIPSVMDGAIVAEPGSLFNNARYQVVDLIDTAGMVNGGYKTFTLSNGDQLFARYKTEGNDGATYFGAFEIIGGSGQFTKVTGGGTWRGTFVADAVLVDELEGTYTLP